MVNCQKDKMKNYGTSTNPTMTDCMPYYNIRFLFKVEIKISQFAKRVKIKVWVDELFFSAIHDQLSCIYR